MNRCKACRGSFRIGKRRAILNEDGSVTLALVCGACASRAFSVIRPIGAAAVLCVVCSAEPARVCGACITKHRGELVSPILAQLAALAKAASLNGQPERAEGMESAMRALTLEVERGPA